MVATLSAISMKFCIETRLSPSYSLYELRHHEQVEMHNTNSIVNKDPKPSQSKRSTHQNTTWKYQRPLKLENGI